MTATVCWLLVLHRSPGSAAWVPCLRWPSQPCEEVPPCLLSLYEETEAQRESLAQSLLPVVPISCRHGNWGTNHPKTQRLRTAAIPPRLRIRRLWRLPPPPVGSGGLGRRPLLHPGRCRVPLTLFGPGARLGIFFLTVTAEAQEGQPHLSNAVWTSDRIQTTNAFHRPVQVTWPSPTSVGYEGPLTCHGEMASSRIKCGVSGGKKCSPPGNRRGVRGRRSLCPTGV